MTKVMSSASNFSGSAFMLGRRRSARAAMMWLFGFALMMLLLTGAAKGQTVTYIHTDALGSVVAESDEKGNVIRRYDYEPFGAIVDGAVADGPGYAGHVSDAITGLSYMQQRYYDPQIGRFLSVDPVTANSSSDTRLFGRYQYAFNNPYRFTDPDGRCPVCVPFVAGLMIYLTSGPANAPAVGEKTSDMPEGEQIASAIPGGGPTARTIRFGVKQIDSQLRRPYIRKDVRQEVERRAPRAQDGRPIDPNTNKPIDGKPDLGHKTGNEHRTEAASAKAEGLTQKQFNDRMNNPDKYQLEDPSSNRSHRFEKKP